jgi:lipopolysaccharide export system protein LptA
VAHAGQKTALGAAGFLGFVQGFAEQILMAVKGGDHFYAENAEVVGQYTKAQGGNERYDVVDHGVVLAEKVDMQNKQHNSHGCEYGYNVQ